MQNLPVMGVDHDGGIFRGRVAGPEDRQTGNNKNGQSRPAAPCEEFRSQSEHRALHAPTIDRAICA